MCDRLWSFYKCHAYGNHEGVGITSKAYGKCFAMDSREVSVMGVIKDVHFIFFAFPEKEFIMNVTMVDIPPQYRMLFSRKWYAIVGGGIQIYLSYVKKIK